MASVLQGALFLIGLMSAAWTDLRRRQIYDLSGIVIAGAGLISFSPARLLGLALAVPFWLASRRGRGGMGDALLIAASGFLLGFLRGVAGLVLALVLYCLFYLAISKSNELTRQLRQAKLDKEKLMAAEGDATAQRTRELIALLEDGPDFLDRPDTELCGALVAEIIVESNDTLRFRLHNGLELRESIERTVR